MQISVEEYHSLEDSYQGYCKVCDDFTRDCTESDAEGYDCPVCESKDSVVGVGNALLMDLLDIVSE